MGGSGLLVVTHSVVVGAGMTGTADDDAADSLNS